MSNKLYGCYITGEPQENMILIRIYGKGTEIFVNRHVSITKLLNTEISEMHNIFISIYYSCE